MATPTIFRHYRIRLRLSLNRTGRSVQAVDGECRSPNLHRSIWRHLLPQGAVERATQGERVRDGRRVFKQELLKQVLDRSGKWPRVPSVGAAALVVCAVLELPANPEQAANDSGVARADLCSGLLIPDTHLGRECSP